MGSLDAVRPRRRRRRGTEREADYFGQIGACLLDLAAMATTPTQLEDVREIVLRPIVINHVMRGGGSRLEKLCLFDTLLNLTQAPDESVRRGAAFTLVALFDGDAPFQRAVLSHQSETSGAASGGFQWEEGWWVATGMLPFDLRRNWHARRNDSQMDVRFDLRVNNTTIVHGVPRSVLDIGHLEPDGTSVAGAGAAAELDLYGNPRRASNGPAIPGSDDDVRVHSQHQNVASLVGNAASEPSDLNAWFTYGSVKGIADAPEVKEEDKR